jgi:hypothetical protein
MGNQMKSRSSVIFQLYMFSHVWGESVNYKTGFRLDDWIYCTLYVHISGLQVIQRYRLFTHFTIHSYIRTRILSLH